MTQGLSPAGSLPSRARGATWSLRRRLLGQLLLVFAGLAVLLYLSVQAVAGRAADATQDNILGASAIAIAEQVRVVAGAVTVDLPYAALEMLGLAGEDRVFYRIASGKEGVITGYEDLPSGAAPASEDAPLFFSALYRGDTVRIATVRRSILIGGKRETILITVAQTREAHGELTSNIALSAAAVGGGFLALAGLLAWIAISRTLKPVHEIERALAARASDDFSALETPAPREIVPLIDAINDFVERLRTTLDTSQQFIAEAAHRIRTPLSALKAQAEVSLKAGPQKTSEESLRRVLRAADETSQLTTQLLTQAMVAYRAERAERQRLSLADLTRTAARDLEISAEMRGIDFRMALIEDAAILGDEIALLEAIRNLLDNAIKYGPADDFVEITVAAKPSPEVTVADHGPGIQRKERDLVFDRFRRGAVVGDIPGSGLGLSIVRQVMRSHRGRVRLEDNQPQGLKVRLTFPSIRKAGNEL